MRISVKRYYADLINLVELANLVDMVPAGEFSHRMGVIKVAEANSHASVEAGQPFDESLDVLRKMLDGVKVRPHRPDLANITDFFAGVPEPPPEPERSKAEPDRPSALAIPGTTYGTGLLGEHAGSRQSRPPAQQVVENKSDILKFWTAVRKRFDGHPAAPVAISASGLTCLYNNPRILLDDIRNLKMLLRSVAERMKSIEPVLKAISESDREIVSLEGNTTSRSWVSEELMPTGNLKRDNFVEDKCELTLPGSPERRLRIQADGTAKPACADLCGDILPAVLGDEKNLRRLKICPICNTLFFGFRLDEIACSKAHRKTENQRRFREKNPGYDRKFRTKEQPGVRPKNITG